MQYKNIYPQHNPFDSMDHKDTKPKEYLGNLNRLDFLCHELNKK
jgi:hypothetical protein